MNQVELDTFIAERLMHWDPCIKMVLKGAFWSADQKRTKQILGGEMYLKRQESQNRSRAYEDRDQPGDGFTFSPSTCIVDAMEALQEAKRQQYVIVIHVSTKETVVLVRRNEWHEEAMAVASDIPEALCLALMDAIQNPRV